MSRKYNKDSVSKIYKEPVIYSQVCNREILKYEYNVKGRKCSLKYF